MAKPMTNHQGLDFARMGRDKNVLAEQVDKRKRDLGLVLDAIKNDQPITIGTPLAQPVGGLIHTLTVKVRQEQDWQEAINAAGPDTPDSYNVRKVGDLYPAVGKGTSTEELVLLNYPRGNGSWEKALTWASEMRLHRTDPRTVFAIGEQYPNFHLEVGINPTYAVATEDCSFGGGRQACYVWWVGAERKAYLGGVSSFGRRDWFVFRK